MNQHPEVRTDFVESRSADQIELLHRGAIDIALLRMPIDDAELVSRVVLRESLVLATPSNHPFQSMRSMSPADLTGQPFVTFSPVDSRYFAARIDRILADSGAEPMIIQRAALHTILAYVEAGVGIALVPESVARASSQDVAFVPLQLPEAQRVVELSAVWSRHSTNSPLINRWLKAIEPICSASPPGVQPLP